MPHGVRNLGALVVLLAVAGGVVLLWNDQGAPRRPSTAGQPAGPTAVPACRAQDAVGKVQQYQAPGQTLGLQAYVATNLAADRRPTQAKGWSFDPAPAADTCFVWFTASVGNEEQRYGWTYDLQTGRVEARDDATKRLSGW